MMWTAEGINEGLPGRVHVCTTAAHSQPVYLLAAVLFDQDDG